MLEPRFMVDGGDILARATSLCEQIARTQTYAEVSIIGTTYDTVEEAVHWLGSAAVLQGLRLSRGMWTEQQPGTTELCYRVSVS